MCTALAAASWSAAAFSFTQSSLPFQSTNSSWRLVSLCLCVGVGDAKHISTYVNLE